MKTSPPPAARGRSGCHLDRACCLVVLDPPTRDRLRCQRNRTVHALRGLLAPWREAQLREAESTAPVPEVAGTLGAPTPSWDGSEFTLDD